MNKLLLIIFSIAVANITGCSVVHFKKNRQLSNISTASAAYAYNNTKKLNRISNHGNRDFNILIKSMLSAQKFQFVEAENLVKKCVFNKFNPQKIFVRLICLSALSSYYSYESDIKSMKYYENQTIKFMINNFEDISAIYGKKNTEMSIREHNNNLVPLKFWKNTTFMVNKKWRVIYAGNGFISSKINGKKILLQIDTGSNGIQLSHDDAVAANMFKNKNAPLTTFNNITYVGKVKSIYYNAGIINLGPMTIHNLPVAVESNYSNSGSSVSTVGIDILKKLRNFQISKNYLYHYKKMNDFKCVPLNLLTSGITDGWWGVSIVLDTSLGPMNVMIDTGSHSDSKDVISVFQKYAIKNKKNINVYYGDKISVKVPGKKLFGTRFFFKLKIKNLKEHFNSAISPYFVKPFTPAMDGVLNYNMFKLYDFQIYLNFDKNKACYSAI